MSCGWKEQGVSLVQSRLGVRRVLTDGLGESMGCPFWTSWVSMGVPLLLGRLEVPTGLLLPEEGHGVPLFPGKLDVHVVPLLPG